MPNTSLTFINIREELKSFLGAPIVEIELVDTQISKAIRDTVRVLNQFRPQRAWAALQQASPSVKQYNITGVHPKRAGVIDVGIVDTWQIGAAGNYLDPFQYQKVTTIMGGETYGQIQSEASGYIKIAAVHGIELNRNGRPCGSPIRRPRNAICILICACPMDVAFEGIRWYLDETPCPGPGDTPTDAKWQYGMQNITEGDLPTWTIDFYHGPVRSRTALGRAACVNSAAYPMRTEAADSLDGG